MFGLSSPVPRTCATLHCCSGGQVNMLRVVLVFCLVSQTLATVFVQDLGGDDWTFRSNLQGLCFALKSIETIKNPFFQAFQATPTRQRFLVPSIPMQEMLIFFTRTFTRISTMSTIGGLRKPTGPMRKYSIVSRTNNQWISGLIDCFSGSGCFETKPSVSHLSWLGYCR